MLKRTQFITIVTISIAILVLFTTIAIVINSPYYNGFEKELNYLSPDLSENRTVLRDSVYISKKSVIKIVFEKKYNQIEYDEDLFKAFIQDVEIQIWNDNEYYTFDNRNIKPPDITSNLFEVEIGELSGSGKYFIYINSDFGVNPAHHIGIGIGRERHFFPPGPNSRHFY